MGNADFVLGPWDDVPEVDQEWLEFTDDELEGILGSLAASLAYEQQQYKPHDQDGWFAEFAGSTACLALGHKPNEYGEWDEDAIHESGWDGETLCTSTKYGSACTHCEGECDMQAPPSLWALPGVLAST